MSQQQTIETIDQKGPEGKRLDAPPSNLGPGSGIIYFGNRLCPFSQRVWITSIEKGIHKEMEYIHIDLGKKKQEWYVKEINPSGTIPCIIDDGKKVTESLLGAEYLEDRFPDRGNSILPKDPYQRFAVRLFLQNITPTLPPAFLGLLKNNDPNLMEEKKGAIIKAMQSLNEALKKQSDGPFFLGDQFTLADISIVPFLQRFSTTLKHYRNFDIFSIPNVERVKKLYDAAMTRPSLKETSQDPELHKIHHYQYTLG